MSEYQTHPKKNSVRYAMIAWLTAFILFFAWLLFSLADMTAQPGRKADTAVQEESPQPSEENSIYALDTLPPWGSLATPSQPFSATDEYVLTGYGLQGFHQQTADSSIWTLSYPAPILNAQLIKRGESPEIVTENIRISWELQPQAILAAPAGEAKQEENAASRRGDMEIAEDGRSFQAEIPVTARQTDGILNPYPIVSITATETGSGKLLARSATVLAVSPGFGCTFCHSDDGYAILEVHDRHQGTDLQSRAKQGTPIACRSCHSGLGMDTETPEAGSGLSVSAAIHGWHVQYMPDQGAESCLTCHSGLGSSPDEKGERPRPLFARDLHIERGLDCTRCHGGLEDHALALLLAEKKAGQTLADAPIDRIRPKAVSALEDITPRIPWLQQPDCTGCHDFEAKPDYETASSFNNWTKDRAGLFSSRSDEMDSVRCLSCHGAPHAIYPADNPVGRDRDNIVPIQYQQHARPLGDAGNCALCHMQPMDVSAHHNLVTRSSTQIHVPDGAELTLPSVHFAHSAHKSFECTVCHHTGHEDGKSLFCTSSGCHDGIKDNGTDETPDSKYFRTAFHGPVRSCFHCHSTAKAEGRSAGPVACKDCHTAPSPRWEETGKEDGTLQSPPPGTSISTGIQDEI